MFDSIRQIGTDYYEALPNHIAKAVGVSAVLSFTVTALFSKTPDGVIDLARPLFAAGVAATASLIHGLTEPLFKSLFPRLDGNMYVELIKWTVVTVVSSALLHSLLFSQGTSTKFVLYSAFSMNWLHSLFDSNFKSVDNSAYIYFG